MKRSIIFLSATLVLCGTIFATAPLAGKETTAKVSQMPVESTNLHYPSFREPMVPQQLIKLPVGSITPGGWLGRQIELQKNGLLGHLGEISAWLQKNDNAWLTTGGQWGWEEVPYWLRGYASTAYVTKDDKMLQEAKIWIDAIIASQGQDGNFGPAQPSRRSKQGVQDYWPNMLALWILQDWYDYTSDERVIPFMERYCDYLLKVPDDLLFESYWENSRAGDNLWTVAWLYSRTGEKRLLELAEKIHRNTAVWYDPARLPNWHNVNIAQCFREPATWYTFCRDEKMLMASYGVQSFVRRAFGQVPGGMFGADENARIGYFDPRQGTETCGFAEQMASDEIMMLITADPLWAANCEDIAFNSYPACFTPDYKALRYFTCPNMAVSDSENHNPSINNKGPFLNMNPFSSRCCQHNHGFAWPYYSQYLVMATPDNGAAIALYSECKANIKVGKGADVIVLHEKTHYPFETGIGITVETERKVSFPLYLLVPKWCKTGATALVNGRPVKCELEAGKYLRIEREWKNGDTVQLDFPMELSTRTWAVNKGSISVDYGPLTMSLRIGETYQRMDDAKKVMIGDSKVQDGVRTEDWPAYNIIASTPWNYALCTSEAIELVRKEWPSDNNPFTQEGSPILFKAKGRLIPSWGFDATGLTSVLPEPWEKRSEQMDEIELIPMGAARLRISAFPPEGISEK